MKLLVFLLSLAMGHSAQAMELVKLECSGCQYEKKSAIGSTKQGILRDGLANALFFCTINGQFVELWTVGDEKAFSKSKSIPQGTVVARPTTVSVASGSKYKFYNHPSCKNQLVPLDFYRTQPHPVCPICGKGELTVESLRFLD